MHDRIPAFRVGVGFMALVIGIVAGLLVSASPVGAQTDAIELKSSDGSTDVPRLVVTTSTVSGQPAGVRVENSRLDLSTGAVLKLGQLQPSSPLAGDVRFDGTNIQFYDGSVWSTLARASNEPSVFRFSPYGLVIDKASQLDGAIEFLAPNLGKARVLRTSSPGAVSVYFPLQGVAQSLFGAAMTIADVEIFFNTDTALDRIDTTQLFMGTTPIATDTTDHTVGENSYSLSNATSPLAPTPIDADLTLVLLTSHAASGSGVYVGSFVVTVIPTP